MIFRIGLLSFENSDLLFSIVLSIKVCCSLAIYRSGLVKNQLSSHKPDFSTWG
jgi:hypothetical protein